MNTRPSLRRGAKLLLVGLTMLTLPACQSVGSGQTRRLPAADLIIPDPAPRPTIKRGDDARLLARKALSYGDSNADRLTQAREAYEAIRRHYESGEP